MHYKERVPEQLFEEGGHYLGRPADATDRIISRRVNLVRAIDGFVSTDKTLLEIGCGNGATTLMLAPDMKSVLAIDIVDEYKQDILRQAAEKGLNNCAFMCVNIEDDGAAVSGTFDRIISFEVIEHLQHESSVAFFREKLADDGILAISVPNKWWIFETHGAKLPLLPWNRVPFFSWLPRPLHERWANARIYTKKRIERLLREHGFEILSSRYITAPMDVLPEGKFKRWVIRNFFANDTTQVPFKSTSIFVVARKAHPKKCNEDGACSPSLIM
jgi:2-polyprenyl-3-methyl-5-hydroxy-6-metoxy-1,4-benzoquinol methylase